MKARSPALAAAQSKETTTLAWLLKITATDGRTLCRPSIDGRVVFEGEVYDPVDGIAPTAIQGSPNLSVQNMDVAGFLTALGINEEDIIGGVWDGAAVVLVEVDYTNIAAGAMELQRGTLGNISASRLSYSAELRSFAQSLQQTVGDVYTKGCTARFGDSRCKVNTDSLMVTGSITSVVDRRHFADASRAEVADYFGAGLITFLTGENAGYSLEIAQYLDGAIEPVLPFPQNVAVGDTYEMIPGCRKRFLEDCKTKWVNVLNFRGFPVVPGGDKVLGLGGTEGTNL